jgi:hypothetical protein
MKQILYLPDYSPISLNKLLKMHWAEQGRVKKGDKQIVSHYAGEQMLKPAIGKRRVSLFVTLAKGGKRMDEDNIFKVLLDSLVACGLLKNDSPNWVERGKVTWAKGETRETFVLLEDV